MSLSSLTGLSGFSQEWDITRRPVNGAALCQLWAEAFGNSP